MAPPLNGQRSIEELDDNDLCECCKGINLQSLKASQGYEHQSTYKLLLKSSSTCSLCDLIAKSIKRNRNSPLRPDVAGNIGPVRIVGAGRSLALQGTFGRRGHEGPVDEMEIWQEVAVSIGKKLDKTRCFSTLGAQLVMVTAEGSAAESAGVQAIQPNGRCAFSKRNIRQIRDRLRDCHENHHDCSVSFFDRIRAKFYEEYKGYGLPSRLIDVMMENREKVQLIDLRDQLVKYVALSYCWGKSQRFVTTKANLEEIQDGIEVSCLAKAVQDAITLTRELGIRYLWVDALCIIQDGDNGADWLEESKKMGLIYAQSYATIGAASGTSSDDSFLYAPRCPYVKVPFRETPKSRPKGTLLFKIPSFDFAEDFEIATYESPLSKRAWVMQERLFSRRTIHFTEYQVYWECRSVLWAEDGESRKPLYHEGSKMTAMFLKLIWSLANIKSYKGKDAALHKFLSMWSELLDDYSELELTSPTDRLPAVAGLAQIASLVFPSRYLSGIWERDLSRGLLWTPRKRPMTLVEEKCAPSWSWACTTDAIRSANSGPPSADTDSCIKLQQVLKSESGTEILEVLGQIHKCCVSVDLESKAASNWKDPPIVEENYTLWPDFSDDLENSKEGDETANNICRFDGERGDEAEFFFLRLECSANKTFHHCQGLLLVAEKNLTLGQISYIRVGVGWASHSIWHETPITVVRLK